MRRGLSCGLLYFAHDAQVTHCLCQCTIYAQDLCKILSQCAIYAQDCTYYPNAQDLRKIVLIFPIRNICTRLYFFPQCAIYAQDLRKIVLISPMCDICKRFAQDCTYFSNAQYMRKICARFAQDLHKICTRLYFSPQCAKIAGIIGRNMSHTTYLL